MRKKIIFSLTLLLATPLMVSAADTTIGGTTLLRLEQRSLPGFSKENLAPATQYLSIESYGIKDPNLSFHMSGWGRVDLADNSTDKSSDGSVAYGYLSYRLPTSNSEARLGRFYVFEGVSLENVDGLYLKAGLTNGFTASVYGGAPVKPASAVNNRGDFIYGGRLSYLLPAMLELGVSSMYESKLNIGSGPITDLRDARSLIGTDLWLKPHQMVDLKGKLSYDTINSGIASNNWLLSVIPNDKVRVSVDYASYEFKEYFAASAIRSLFNPDSNDKQTVIGGSVSMQVTKPLEVTALFKHYDRDTTGTSDKYGLDGRLQLFDGKGLSGASYYRVSAPAGINSFHETRAYLMYNANSYSASVDGIIHIYDDKINGKKFGSEIQGSLGYKFMPNLQLSGDVSYGQNPAYTSEVKGLLRLTFNYNTSGGAGK